MKKIFSKSILTAMALVLFLSSCISEICLLPKPPDNGIEGYKSISLHISQSKPDTRGISRPVCHGELLEFNSGDLYLVNAAGLVVRHYRIIRRGVAGHDFSAGIINRDELDFRNPLSTASLRIPNVPGNVTRAYIIGNTPNNDTQGSIYDIINRQINIITQHSALTPEGQPQKPGVNLFGSTSDFQDTGIYVDGFHRFLTQINLAPTVARIEIGSIVGAGSIADFTVEGIFIDGHYRQARISGYIPHHGEAANRKDRGTNAAFFQEGQPYFPAGSNALFDLRPDNNIDTWRGRRANVHGAPNDALLRVTPGGYSDITCTAINCSNIHNDVPNVWAYQVFAHSWPLPRTRMPRVVIRLSNIRLIDGTFVTDNDYRYVTVRRFYDNANPIVFGIEAGVVYHIEAVWFDENDLRYVPNYLPPRGVAHSRVTTFVNVMYDFQQQPLRASTTLAGMSTTPTAWQWQISTDNATWTNINGATTSTWTLPANFIHHPAAHGLPATMFDDVNELYFRNVMTFDGVEDPLTQLADQTLAIRFIRTTHTGVANPTPADFIDGFGMTGTIRWADINRAPHMGFGPPTIRIALLNEGASDYDGGLGYLFQWGRIADGHQEVDWDKDAYGNTIIGAAAVHTVPFSLNISFDSDGQVTNAPYVGRFISTGIGGPFTAWGWNTNTFDDLWGNGHDWMTWSVLWGGSSRFDLPISLNQWTPRGRNNTPCPPGWRVPSQLDWSDMHSNDGVSELAEPMFGIGGLSTAWGAQPHSNTYWQWRPMRAGAAGGAIITNTSGNTDVYVFLPAAGRRTIEDGSLTMLTGPGNNIEVPIVGVHGLYWSSTFGMNALTLVIGSGGINSDGSQGGTTTYGNSIRCVIY